MWSNVRVGDLGTVVTGRTPSSHNPTHFGGKYPFITPSDMGDVRVVETERYISEEGHIALRRQVLPSRSVCFVCIGATIGKICMTAVESITNQQINSIIVDRKHHDPFFVYYLLSTYGEKAKAIASGSATPIVNKTAFESLEASVPPLPIQRKIAAILSVYDDLIENNLRRIKILEEMAQNLYREWFVKFRFPGHEQARFVDSLLGRVPQDWEIAPIGSLIGGHIGGGWGNETCDSRHTEGAWVIRGTDIPNARYGNLSGVSLRYHRKTNLSSRSLHPGDIIFEVSGGSKGQPLGRSLYLTQELLGAFHGTSVMCASFCKRICPDPRKYASEILYLSILDGYTSGEIEQFQVQSTGISNFKWSEYLASVERCVPPARLQDQFRGLVVPLFSLTSNLGRINTVLSGTRDLLLPRLISGELDVSELDITVPEEART